MQSCIMNTWHTQNGEVKDSLRNCVHSEVGELMPCSLSLSLTMEELTPQNPKCLCADSTDCSLCPGGCTPSRFCICTVPRRRM